MSDPGLLGPVELLNSREVELPKLAIDDNDEARKLLIAPKDTVSMVGVFREEFYLTVRIDILCSIRVVSDFLELVDLHHGDMNFN